MCKQIKLLFVVKNLSVGGSQIRTVRLADELSKKGFRIRIVSLGRTNHFSREFSYDVVFSKYFDALRSIPFFSPVLASFYGLYEIARQIRFYNPDVICAMQWAAKMPTSMAGVLLRKKTVLVEISNSRRELERKKIRNKWHPRFLARRIAYSVASAVVANSKGLADSTASYFNLPRISMIYNGIDVKTIQQMSTEPTESFWLDRNIPMVVAVGRLVEQKGFEFLIEAIKLLNDENMEIRLLILGGGELRERLDRKIKDCGICHLVKISGFVNNPYPYMAKGDIFACSSLSEGMSNSILEAMALRLPIVSTDHQFGAGEMIEHEVNGLLVPVRDSKAMADAIRNLVADDKLGRRLVCQADETIRKFTLEAMVENHGDLFKSLTVR
ncbi:MAG: glycosyltransferase [Candidatus Dadabacteria bacterium]|nr:glycosyltransferase [Candidatus Dadabacteria bacterium]